MAIGFNLCLKKNKSKFYFLGIDIFETFPPPIFTISLVIMWTSYLTLKFSNLRKHL